MSEWDLVEKSPAVRLAIETPISDFAYVEFDEIPSLARIVWAHRLDCDPPEPSPEQTLDFALEQWAARHPKAVAKYWSGWIQTRRQEITWLRYHLKYDIRRNDPAALAALAESRQRFLRQQRAALSKPEQPKPVRRYRSVYYGRRR
jgi:hypothetical protein